MQQTCDPEKLNCRGLLDAMPFDAYAIDLVSNEIVFANRNLLDRRPDILLQSCYVAINGVSSPCTFCRRQELVDADRQPNGKMLTYEFFNESDETWYQLRERAMLWSDGRVVKYVIAVNISDLKRTQNQLAEAHAELALKNRELEQLAYTDNLTKIFNRRKLHSLFQQESNQAIAQASAFSIISVDIDHFKQVNDTYGHDVGDKVLIEVTEAMKSSLRSSDILGRWGGEEFLILCPNTPLHAAELLAERLRAAVAAKTYASGQVHTVSIGIASQALGDKLSSMLHRADQALYKAKHAGRNRVCSASASEA
jgi:diguanylate cyclase (GGDEF)-like protein